MAIDEDTLEAKIELYQSNGFVVVKQFFDVPSIFPLYIS